MKNFAAMTDAELNTRIRELSNILNGEINDDWDKAYKEYCQLTAIQNERYRLVNQEAFNAFYERNIKGKKWEEIDDDTWSFYSDWHKDMYGYRPRTI